MDSNEGKIRTPSADQLIEKIEKTPLPQPLKQECTPILDHPIIIVATEDELHEMMAKSLLITSSNLFNILKMQSLLRGILVRTTAMISKISWEEYRNLPREERDLLLVKLYTGADFRIPRFSPDQARILFEFEGGQIPQSGSVYFLHPFRPKHYLIPSSVNITLAREKVFVFNQLAGYLGAKKITLRSGIVKTRKWSGKAKVPISDAAAQVGIHAHFDAESKDLTQVYAEFDKPLEPLFVPDHLELWVKSDPLFQSMVNSRLGSRLRKQKVTLEFKERAIYGASVVGKYNNLGLDIGGKYEELIHSVWHCDVNYWPIE